MTARGTEDITADIYRLTRERERMELDERGDIRFQWRGAEVVAVAVPRPSDRPEKENYWRAEVGSGLTLFSNGQRDGVYVAWTVSASAGHAYRSVQGDSLQDAVDRMCSELVEFRDDLDGFLKQETP